MAGLKTVLLKVEPMANFAYVLVDEKSKGSLVVDSGWEAEPVMEAVEKEGAGLNFVVVSHEHFNHTSTLGSLPRSQGQRWSHTRRPQSTTVSRWLTAKKSGWGVLGSG
jgi:glyoxylase-like metal-dependent hydrolase (beta-lactamase superfamily II)